MTQGFIGATADGTPTTLGRGGSDFTAALLGAVLDVERVEIWTDVNGLMTADPRIVPSARTLRAASYEEAAELATFGAKVLHPATALPLVRAGIPIVVLNSTRPDDPGTTIEPSAELERMGDSPVRSISWKRGITVVNVRAPRMLGAYGFLRAMFEVFERHEVVVDVLASGEVSVSLTVEDRTRLDPWCATWPSWARSGSRTAGRSSRSSASASAPRPGSPPGSSAPSSRPTSRSSPRARRRST